MVLVSLPQPRADEAEAIPDAKSHKRDRDEHEEGEESEGREKKVLRLGERLKIRVGLGGSTSSCRLIITLGTA